MLWRSLPDLILLFAVAICIVSTGRPVYAQAARSRPTDAVVVSIRPESVAEDDVVLVSDVARIETPNQELKSLIESLDVCDAPKSGESVFVTASLIEMRLRLAGIDVRRVTIRGQRGEVFIHHTPINNRANLNRSQGGMLQVRGQTSSSPRFPSAIVTGDIVRNSATTSKGVSIRTDEAETRTCDEIVTEAARRCVLEQLPWHEDGISIRLVQPISHSVQGIESVKSSLFAAELHSPGPPVGRVQVEVTVESADRSTTVVPVVFDVRHFDNVVATKKPMARGREIQLEDLYVHRWDVTGSADYSSDPKKLVGKIVKHAMPALQIIRDQDIESSQAGQGQNNLFVVKRQDRVKMIAKIGDLNITVPGQAQQDGRVGDMIRVQNVESKTIIQGRVLGINEVEIID